MAVGYCEVKKGGWNKGNKKDTIKKIPSYNINNINRNTVCMRIALCLHRVGAGVGGKKRDGITIEE